MSHAIDLQAISANLYREVTALRSIAKAGGFQHPETAEAHQLRCAARDLRDIALMIDREAERLAGNVPVEFMQAAE